ncbi:MAG: GNAT family N-acetyltransferase [Thermoanaerobaculia bacterium]
MSAQQGGVSVRFATVHDIGTILDFIRQLAEYEKLAHQVVADEATLTAHLFGDRPMAEVLIAEVADAQGTLPAGFALFFHNFSTFLGRPGIYLEDLFVRPGMRGLGIGGTLLAHLARVAVERGCGRFEWSVLDWNEPAIGFYRALGAQALDEWTVFRVSGEALARLAERAQ